VRTLLGIGLVVVVFGALFAGVIVPAANAQQAEVTFESLLREMMDRSSLARLPAPAFTCRQFSSYDRDTTGPDQPGWFANWDRSQFIRSETNEGRTEHVLMDTAGPGAVVRFWGTWHGPEGGAFTNGILRVYLDGSDSPVIEGPIVDLISGGALAGEPLSSSCSPLSEFKRRAHNLYLPIPYAGHCKITYESDAITDVGAKKGEALYYQINYRTYDPGTQVESFSMQDLVRAGRLLASVQRDLARSARPGHALGVRQVTGELAPGASRSLEMAGPAAIRELVLNISAADLEQALRSTVLEMTFDDERTVWAPVGDFFGTGHRRSPHRTWYTEVIRDGSMACFWVMPFAEWARLEIHNLGEQTVTLVLGQVRSSDWNFDDRSLHFHSAWRQYAHAETKPHGGMGGDHAEDLNFIEIEGDGQYVGDCLAVYNGAKSWWGEGDEKIFVDGEAFPSHIGTGTEDYYGYAWCRPEFFENPFHAQPKGGGNLKGGFSVNCRYRALDAIPFRKSLKFDMELWHWAATRINYAPTTFWYARPGARRNVEPAPDEARRLVPRSRDEVNLVVGVEGALEGEAFEVLEHSGGKTEVQEDSQYDWSWNRQLWWIDAAPEDTLVLEFEALRKGSFRIIAHLTCADDYGIVKLAVNGQDAACGPIDLYAPEVQVRMIELGVFSIEEGANRLSVTITGHNPEAKERHMFGLDYLMLKEPK